MTLLHQLWSRVVFAYSGDSYFVSGGNIYLRDHGPSGLNALFAAGGAAPTPQLDGSLLFDGGDYLTLPLSFYSVAPTGAHTWIVVGGASAVLLQPRLFSCWNSTADGTDKGIALAFYANLGIHLQRLRAHQGQGAALWPYETTPAGAPFVIGHQSSATLTVETTPRAFVNTASTVPVWSTGAFGTASYDSTLAPRIGMDPAGTNPLTGRLYYVACISGAVTNPDLLNLNRMLREGSKPFCGGT